MQQVLTRVAVATTAVGLAAGMVASTATPAGAHVGITPSTTEAGATAELELSVPHGCDGSPTTRLSVQIPTGVLAVVPTRSGFWDVQTEVTELTQPVTDTHGNEITERVTSVTWTATEPLPDGVDDELVMTLQLPAEEGTQLWFPVVQQCREAESAWIEVGLVAEHGDEAVAVEEAADPTAPEDDAAGGTPVLGLAGLGLGLLGAVLGGTALVRQRRGA